MSATIKACVALVMLVSFCHEFTAGKHIIVHLRREETLWYLCEGLQQICPFVVTKKS